MRGSTTKLAEENHVEEPSQNADPESSKKATGKGRTKRAKVSMPEAETDYFSENHNLEDLLQHKVEKYLIRSTYLAVIVGLLPRQKCEKLKKLTVRQRKSIEKQRNKLVRKQRQHLRI
ncbi:hypothetical protein BUALT_Bualt01G0246500 [Buddleja alternifolia]|uniref:Uncharacterized protein n=1 Tax=Buddleja alternifolia TaxID=168488 RepID=A0AAV6YAQ7_9LAMI|nr:hypothetical protein BUALT_Bualt01G0246500 [Buddleja alternifolia]